MILIDTSGLVAALLPDQRRHEECFRALTEATPPLILPTFVLAEADYLIQKFGGLKVELRFLNEVGSGAYELAVLNEREVQLAAKIISQYSDMKIGLTDASIVVIGDRYGCRDVLTLDERHFRALVPLGGRRRFRLLPADL